MRLRPSDSIRTFGAASLLAMASSSLAGTSNWWTARGGIGDSDRTQPYDSRNGILCCMAWGGIGCDDAACQAAVCAVDSYCCAVEWDQICADEAQTLCPELCWGPPPTCTGGDCCTASGGLGCDDVVCCHGVCMYDAACCAIEWDQICADAAMWLCETYCSTKLADLNGDGIVDSADLGILLDGWGFTGVGDITGDGTTDGVDLGILLGSWTG